MNNEPSVVSQSKVEEVDFSILKISLLALFSVGASMAMVYELNEFISSLQYIFLWLGVLALLMFLVVNILNVFFIKHRSILYSLALVETALPILLFMSRIRAELWPLVIAFSLFFVFVVAGLRQGKAYLENSIKIRFFAITKLVTPRLVTGVLIGVSIVFYMQCFSLGGTCAEGVGREFVKQTLNASQPIVNLWVPSVSPNQTVADFFHQFAVAEVNSTSFRMNSAPIITNNGISEIPVKVKDQIIDSFSAQLRKTVEDKVGPLNPKESVLNEVYRVIVQYLSGFSEMMKKLMSVGVAVLLFFLLKGFGFLVYWFVDLVAFLIYKLLIAANFATVNYETRNREFVILP